MTLLSANQNAYIFRANDNIIIIKTSVSWGKISTQILVTYSTETGLKLR